MAVLPPRADVPAQACQAERLGEHWDAWRACPQTAALVSERALVQSRLSSARAPSTTPTARLPKAAASGAAINGGMAPPTMPARL